MKQMLFAGCLAMCLLAATTVAYSEEAPLVIAKDNRKDVVKFDDLIAKNGSVVVWITLDPSYVGFSPGLKGISEEEKLAQDARIARELNRIVSPLLARKRVSLVGGDSIRQFGTSGLLRINHKAALRHILASKSVALVSRAAL